MKQKLRLTQRALYISGQRQSILNQFISTKCRPVAHRQLGCFWWLNHHFMSPILQPNKYFADFLLHMRGNFGQKIAFNLTKPNVWKGSYDGKENAVREQLARSLGIFGPT